MIGRPKLPRCIRFNPRATYFKPVGMPMRFLEEVRLSPDEVEAIRLKDDLGFNQVVCADRMRISQPTFARIIRSAHHKIARALIRGQAIRIDLTDLN